MPALKTRPAKLTPKQQRFAEEYLVDLNATQAAIRAGYSKRTAREMGYENLTKPHIQAAVRKALDAQSKRTAITADNVLREFARLAFANLTDVVDVNSGTVVIEDFDDLPREVTAAISEVAQTKDGIRVKFHSKTQALEALGRHLALFNDKLKLEGELPVKPDMSHLSDEDLEQLRALVGSSQR